VIEVAIKEKRKFTKRGKPNTYVPKRKIPDPPKKMVYGYRFLMEKKGLIYLVRKDNKDNVFYIKKKEYEEIVDKINNGHLSIPDYLAIVDHRYTITGKWGLEITPTYHFFLEEHLEKQKEEDWKAADGNEEEIKKIQKKRKEEKRNYLRELKKIDELFHDVERNDKS
jgi:hypothetical protein